MDGLLSHALSYLKGLEWNVVPTREGHKYPFIGRDESVINPKTGKGRIIGWQRYSQVRLNEKRIKKFFSNKEIGGIGVITGLISKLVVIDIDIPKDVKKAGYEAATAYSDQLIEDFKKEYGITIECPISRTGSGGLHLFFRHPGGEIINNKVRIHDSGIDIRGDGGFIVLPPTEHVETGIEYRWEVSPFDVDPPTIPRKLLNLIRGKDKENEETLKQTPQKEWVSEVLENGSKEGTRNTDGARLAGYYYSLNMPQDIVLSNLKNWNLKNKPPLDDDELLRITQGVFKTVSNKKSKAIDGLPPFRLERIMQYDGDPIVRVIMTNPNNEDETMSREIVIDMTASEIMNFNRFRTRVSIYLGRLISKVKKEYWEDVVASKLDASLVTDIPEEASSLGVVIDALRTMNVINEDDKEAPVPTLRRSILIRDGNAHFLLKEFMSHLMSLNTGERLRRKDVGKILSDIGFKRKQIRDPKTKKPKHTYYMDISSFNEIDNEQE